MNVRWRDGVVTAGRWYVLAFAAHAALSMVHAASGWAFLDIPQRALAIAVIALSVPVYIAAGCLIGLPRRIFWTLPLYAWFGGPLVLALFSDVVLPSTTDRVAAALEGLVAMAAFLSFRAAPTDGSVVRFASGRLAVFAVFNLVGLPVGLLAAIVSVAIASLHLGTGGYLQIRGDGLYSVERVFRSEGRVVRLVGMSHIGDARFYRELAQSFDERDTIVLEELVRTREADQPYRASVQSGQARAFGLDEQGEFFLAELQHAVVRNADLHPDEIDSRTFEWAEAQSPFDLREDPRPLAGLFARDNRMDDAVYDDVVTRRNARLLAHLDTALEGFDCVIVPWGAAHMPALDAAVRERGFVPDGDVARRVFAWSSIQ